MNSVLFRHSFENEQEEQICSEYFKTINHRTDVAPRVGEWRGKHTVIGRYSVLPYYKELCYDLAQYSHYLINSLAEHLYISEFSYYEDIKEYTFPSWREHEFHTCRDNGPFVVKGATNSKKNQWDTLMFAPTKKDAIEIGCDLKCDGLLGQQEIIYRKYVPLVALSESITGLPFTNEWRFFLYGETILCSGYYWSNADYIPEFTPHEATTLVCKVAPLVSPNCPFYVVDVGEDVDGRWWVVELNDGQMSGLSCCDPHQLYSLLREYVA